MTAPTPQSFVVREWELCSSKATFLQEYTKEELEASPLWCPRHSHTQEVGCKLCGKVSLLYDAVKLVWDNYACVLFSCGRRFQHPGGQELNLLRQPACLRHPCVRMPCRLRLGVPALGAQKRRLLVSLCRRALRLLPRAAARDAR